jgi:dihydrofolate reductase
MARLIYAMNVSLDGYVADRDGNVAFGDITPEVFTAIVDLVRPCGTHLYGRRLYETMAVWQTAHLEPGAPAFVPAVGAERERDFAAVWRGTDKIVFSTTLANASTPRTRIERAFDPDQVRRLKATSERDLTVGGPNLAATMIAANLVDEIHAFVHPISIGGGTPFLPPERRIKLELVDERRMGGILHLHYRPAAR